jgi:parallel beta-helix repeat protein
MWRMEGSLTGAPPHSFTDVFASWQQAPVSWMVDNSITTGTTATTYSPNDPVTRGQIAAFLWRLAGSPAAPPPTQFTDVVKSWQITPVGWMVQQEITTGTTTSTFSPEDTVTRGQAATFFYRYKGSPPAVVDPNHPAIPACEAQVPGPSTTGTLTVTESTTLIQNHKGNIVIAADNITLDCAGHTLIGPGRTFGFTGIDINQRTGVTVRNCVVQDFSSGIVVRQSDGNTFTANSITRVDRGFWLDGSDGNTLTNNSVIDAIDWFGYGVFDGSDGNELRGNTATGVKGVGFIVWASSNNVLTDNVASKSGNGFGANEVGTVGNVFTGNTSNDNTGWGIEDQTPLFGGGTGDAGTDNNYSNNSCSGNGAGPSSPPGLC